MNLLSQKLTAGDSWEWNESFSGYSPDTHTANCFLRLGTNEPIVIKGVKDGETFKFTRKPAETSSVPHGEYTFFYELSKENFSLSTDPEKITINKNLRLASTDPRTQDEIDLENAKAAYSRLIARETDEVDFNGKRLKYTDRMILKKIIDQLERKLGIKKRVPRILEEY